MIINDYMTVKEAAYRWGIEPRRLREKLNIQRRPTLQKDLDNGIVKYFKSPEAKQGDWIISTEAMVEWYGNEPKTKKMEECKMFKVKFEGQEINVTENPQYTHLQFSGLQNSDWYTAKGTDAEGNEVVITWEVIDMKLGEDEGICDWDNPYKVELV